MMRIFISYISIILFLMIIILYPIFIKKYDTNTVRLRSNLDRTKMEHRWKQHKKRKANKKN